MQAADYFADEDAVHTICGVLGRRLFNNDSSQQLGKQHSLDTTIAGLWQEGGCWKNRVQQVLISVFNTVVVLEWPDDQHGSYLV